MSSSVGRTQRLCEPFGCSRTHGGLLHCRLRERTPPPHVLEHEPNFDHEPQFPSWPCGCWLDLQMQWPLKHHYCDKVNRKKTKGLQQRGYWQWHLKLKCCTQKKPPKLVSIRAVPHLSWCTLRAIHRRTFFGFTKVLVVGMTAPQLLARVIGSELNEETAILDDFSYCRRKILPYHSQFHFMVGKLCNSHKSYILDFSQAIGSLRGDLADYFQTSHM